jgi:uncharacterized protein
MSDVNSPCVRNCCLDTEDICLGCFRSIDEIMQWSSVETTPRQKQQILNNAKVRKESRQSPS